MFPAASPQKLASPHSGTERPHEHRPQFKAVQSLDEALLFVVGQHANLRLGLLGHFHAVHRIADDHAVGGGLIEGVVQHIPYLLDVCRGVAARTVILPDAIALEAVDELLDVRGLDGTQLLVSNRGLDDRVDDARILGVGDGLQGTELVVLHP